MRTQIWILMLTVIATGCHSASETSPAHTGPLALWDPVSADFAGCQAACGAHVEGVHADIVAQPGASVGQRTYCPVSGAVFEIDAAHPHVEVDGHTLWFCCAGCAAYFESHRDEVLDVRGLAHGPLRPS